MAYLVFSPISKLRGLGLTGIGNSDDATLKLEPTQHRFASSVVRRRIQARSLAEYAGLRANCNVWHTKKAVLNHFRDFKAIEVLLSHLQKNPLQCFLDILRRERTEFSHEKIVPSDAANLLVEDLKHSPLR
jgi:hypothetical protein